MLVVWWLTSNKCGQMCALFFTNALFSPLYHQWPFVLCLRYSFFTRPPNSWRATILLLYTQMTYPKSSYEIDSACHRFVFFYFHNIRHVVVPLVFTQWTILMKIHPIQFIYLPCLDFALLHWVFQFHFLCTRIIVYIVEGYMFPGTGRLSEPFFSFFLVGQ